MQEYEIMVKECYAPIIQKYNLQFIKYNDYTFFLVGYGFAFWVFANTREERGETWYISINEKGEILRYSLMYIDIGRFTKEDRAFVGNPTTIDEHIEVYFRIYCKGLMNRCDDILSGKKEWLKDYPSKGSKSNYIPKFLKPYFEEQGFIVND